MIFLDMDGVLCDFIGAAFAAHGQRFDPETYPKGVWDCESVIGCNDADEFWQRIDFAGEAFWENLDPYPWASDLVERLCNMDLVTISTSPSRSPYSYSGKRRWLQKHGFDRIDSMFGKSKHLLASTGRVLIDDGEHNTTKWEAAGGVAVLVPQPWNNGDPVDEMVPHIMDQLQKHADAGTIWNDGDE